MEKIKLTTTDPAEELEVYVLEETTINQHKYLLVAEEETELLILPVTVDGEKITDIKAAYSLDDFKGDGKVVKRGKKKFIKVVAK